MYAIDFNPIVKEIIKLLHKKNYVLARINFDKTEQKTFGRLNIGGYRIHAYVHIRTYALKSIIGGLIIDNFI